MFKPQPAFIKERIEKLIDDEFLARDEEDKSMLIYLPWPRSEIGSKYSMQEIEGRKKNTVLVNI